MREIDFGSTKKTNKLEEAIGDLSQAYAMIKGFSGAYHTIWVVDKDTLKMRIIHSTGVSTIKDAVKMGKDISNFDEAFYQYVETYVDEEDRERMHQELKSEVVLAKLDKNNSYTVDYLRVDGKGNKGYHQLLFANADVDGGARQFVYGFRDIDEKVRADQEKTKSLRESYNIIMSLTKVYDAIYYIDLSDNSFIELGVYIDEVNKMIGEKGNAEKAFKKFYSSIVDQEYADTVKEFVDLSNINERLKDKEWIAQEYNSTLVGWAEAIFVASDRNADGTLHHVIFASHNIDKEKRYKDLLEYMSRNDELTGLFNRRAFQEQVASYNKDDSLIPEDLVLISVDVNGLKTINDSLGHIAGDELIKGAADCMRQAYGEYGRLYRTGGDEFIALINVNEKELAKVQKQIESSTDKWAGRLVDGISLSCGYVSRWDNTDLTWHQMRVLADKRMYQAKSDYYKNSGIDRRRQ